MRTGFLLLYPLSVLSATMLVPRRGALRLAGLATALYGGLLLAVARGCSASQGLADVVDLPTRALLYSIFVLGVACVTVALLGSYLAESLQHAGQQLQEAAVRGRRPARAQPGDREQHPERPHDHRRRRPRSST